MDVFAERPWMGLQRVTEVIALSLQQAISINDVLVSNKLI